MAAWSSIRLLVVAGAPPLSSLRWRPYSRVAAQPPGPGLPWQPPSEWMMTFFIYTKRNPVEVSLDGVHGTGNDLLSHNL